MLVDKIILDDFNPQAIAAGIASRMQQARINLNLTQADLARRSGVSLGSLKRFEREYEISLKHLLQIALVLDELGDFRQLFPSNQFQSMDELLESKKKTQRKRARSV